MYFSIIKKAFIVSLVLITSFGLYSFTIKRLGDDVLKQLGISKSAADEKIAQSILGGSLDAYGVKNVKNIVLGSRATITKDLLVYAKGYLQSAGFKKEYQALRQNEMPESEKAQSPEELRKQNILALKKMIVETEASMKNVDASMKPIFEKMLAEGKKQLADAEDPNNKLYLRYQKGYPQLVKDIEERNAYLLKNWEKKYPADPMLFVKPRLEEFLAVTQDIDFNAALTIKNSKKIFVNPAYEQKDNRWKMAFRAGKEVVAPARAFVQQWLAEIK